MSVSDAMLEQLRAERDALRAAKARPEMTNWERRQVEGWSRGGDSA